MASRATFSAAPIADGLDTGSVGGSGQSPFVLRGEGGTDVSGDSVKGDADGGGGGSGKTGAVCCISTTSVST